MYPNEQVDFVAILDNLYQTQNHFTVQHAFGDEGTFYNCGNYIVIKPLEELDSIQNDKQNLTIISQLSNDQTITHSGLQWATIYHDHDFYYYSGQFMTYEEMKKEHPAELLDFYETKIIQKKLK